MFCLILIFIGNEYVFWIRHHTNKLELFLFSAIMFFNYLELSSKIKLTLLLMTRSDQGFVWLLPWKLGLLLGKCHIWWHEILSNVIYMTVIRQPSSTNEVWTKSWYVLGINRWSLCLHTLRTRSLITSQGKQIHANLISPN